MTTQDASSILGKLEDIMAQNKVKFSDDLSTKISNDDSSLNFDDGEVLNLNHKIGTDNKTKKEETKISEEKNEDISYELNSDSADWKDAVKNEMKDIVDIVDIDDQNKNIKEPTVNSIDLDDDFGLEKSETSTVFTDESKEQSLEEKLEAIRKEEVEQLQALLLEQDAEDTSLEETFAKENIPDNIAEEKESEAVEDIAINKETKQKEDIAINKETKQKEDLTINKEIISNEVMTEAKSMFDQLKNTVADKKALPAVGVEEFITNMVKPLLKEWIDSHLPEIVENLVHKEIKKLTND
jgi:uncharacterized protein